MTPGEMSSPPPAWPGPPWPPWTSRMGAAAAYVTLAACLTRALLACPPAPCACPNSTSQVMCVGAQLTDVPRNLPPSTSTLDLSHNLLHTLTASSLSTLRNVVNLKLADNVIEAVQDGAFEPMVSLQTLELGNNRLTRLSEHTFRGAAHTLLHLDLSANVLQEVDGAFADMDQLSRLDLKNNRIAQVTQFSFRDLKNLRYLLLAHNVIASIDKRAFKNLEKLMYLVLKGNPIGDVVRFQFNSYFLSYVDLSECSLSTVPRGLPNSIRYLQLRRNNMTEVRRHTFQDCPYISILVLDENGLTDIQEKTFEEMKYLQQLWLNTNSLRRIPQPLPATLQRLLMDDNQVRDLSDVFPESSQLNTLSLMGNNISYVAYNALYKLPKLKSLDLSNNHIRHLYGETFTNASCLDTLQLSKNPLQFFHSRCLHGLTGLKTLSLAYISTVVSLHSDIFRDLTNLTKLDLDSSHWILRAVMADPQLLAGLSHVQDLSMVGSDFTHLQANFPSHFPRLGVLHVSSARWHCDTSMLWFRNWLLSTAVRVASKEDIACFTPAGLRGKSLVTLQDKDFVATTTPHTRTALPTAGRLTTFPDLPSTTPTPLPTLTPSRPGSDLDQAGGRGSDGGQQGGDPELALAGEGRHDPEYVVSRRPPTWDEVLDMSSMLPLDSLMDLFTTWPPGPGPGPGPDVGSYQPADPQESGDGSSRVDIRTLSAWGPTSPLGPPTAGDTPAGAAAPSHSTLIIIVATTIVTVIIAAVLIFVIVYLVRKQRHKHQQQPHATPTGGATGGRPPHHARGRHGGGAAPRHKQKGASKTSKGSKSDLCHNGIKYKNNKNDVLYFMPKSAEGSTTESIHTPTSKEAMSLIPGRDINHEGPLRVYKWEDF